MEDTDVHKLSTNYLSRLISRTLMSIHSFIILHAHTPNPPYPDIIHYKAPLHQCATDVLLLLILWWKTSIHSSKHKRHITNFFCELSSVTLQVAYNFVCISLWYNCYHTLQIWSCNHRLSISPQISHSIPEMIFKYLSSLIHPHPDWISFSSLNVPCWFSILSYLNFSSPQGSASR